MSEQTAEFVVAPLAPAASGRAFGRFIEQERHRRGWSISRLARETGISGTRLQAILRMDEPKVFGSTLEKMATAFRMTVAQFREACEASRAVA